MKQITIQNLLHNLRDKAQDLIVEYHMTDMDTQTYDARRKKIKKVLKATEKHLSWMLARKDKKNTAPCFPKNKQGNLPYLIEKQKEAMWLMLQDKKFIAIDVECDYNDQSIITEIGWTTFKNGVVKSINVEVTNLAAMTPKRPHRSFIFGATYCSEIKGAIELLRNELIDCDVLIGHDVNSDKKYLKKYINISLPHEFDTVQISKAITGYYRTLRTFAAMFGIAAEHTHNGGNDARYTMDAFLEFVRREPKIKDISKSKEKDLYFWAKENANK